MKQGFTTLLLCCLFSTFIMAQGADPQNATSLTTGTSSVLTDAGTSSGEYGPTPSCGSYTPASGCTNGWFCYTNTGGVAVTLDIDATSILGTDRDVTLVIYSSSNNAFNGTFTELDCENEGTDGDGTIDVSAQVAPGQKVWIRMFDFSCNADVQIDITAVTATPLSDISIDQVDGQNIMLDCSSKNTVLYTITDDNAAGDYTDQSGTAGTSVTQTVTFSAPPGCQVWLKERAPESGVGGGATGDTQICAATNTSASTDCEDSDINDYLKIYDGTNLVQNVIGISASVVRRFGNYKSANGSITLEWITGNMGTGNGWEIEVYCVPDPTINAAVTVGCGAAPISFTDPGGTAGNYGDNAHEIWTFCPAAGCADVVCIDLGTLDIEEYFDALYVFDGMDTNAPLHSIFQGANNTATGILRAMPSNASGCLTFMLLSDAGTDLAGWDSQIYTCPTIGPNGGETCAMATDISSGGTYHNNTYLATGTPNQGGAGMADPAIGNASPVTDGTCFPTQTTASDVTQLESTVWYTFTTPPALCNMAPPVTLSVDNVSCVVSGSGASSAGAQFVLYETSACQTAANWQSTQIFCSDIITAGTNANLASVTFMPNTTYYLMVDAFAGRNCELDLTLDILIPDGGSCTSVPVELSSFYAKEDDCTVNLIWKTESEQNSSHFDVLKSTDGFDYKRIATVQAAGNSVNTIEYSFLDKSPAAINYYRLRQVDLDGTEEYSETITIKPTSCGGDKFEITRLFPNPSSEWINIDLTLPRASQTDLFVYDMAGKMVMQRGFNLDGGTQRVHLPVFELSKGFYSLHIRTSEGFVATPHRFVVN